MRSLRHFFYNKFYIELIAAAALFAVAIATKSMVTIIIYMLYFIIMLEIVRAVMSFLREQRVQIGILIDCNVCGNVRAQHGKKRD